MRISHAARASGVNVQTLRYYERRGLLPRTVRESSGYRDFADEAVQVVRFIKRAQELGFSLDEIEELVRLRRVSARERPRVRAVARRRLGEIDRKMADLAAMRDALATLVDACEHGESLSCPIIEALDAPRSAEGRRKERP